MGAPSRLVDLESLAQDMARLEMDRDTADIVFVVILNTDCHHMLSIHQRFCLVRHGRHVNWRISATVPSGFKCLTLDCTAGHKGVIGDLSSESISAHFQGLQTRVQLAATTCSSQIWIFVWILPNFYM